MILLTTFVACSKDDDQTEPETETHTHEGPEITVLPSSETEIQVANTEIEFGDFATGVNGGTIKTATVVGSLESAHGSFIEIPIGEETVSHTHSHEYHSGL